MMTNKHQTTTRGSSFPSTRHKFTGILQLLASAAIAATLTACKVVIVVPEGGKVISDNGVECLAGQTCVINVSDTTFDENFSAVANEGYVFEQWQEAQGYFCGGSSLACYLTTNSFGGVSGLEALLAGDAEFYLAPEFSGSAPPSADRYDAAEWADLLGAMDSSTYRSNSFLYQTAPDVGNCDPGVMTAQAQSRFTDAVNLIRKLHYLPPVDYDAFYSSEMQQASLVQLANRYLTHSPRSSDDCYTAAAASGAGSSNLSSSSIQRDPASYAIGWANDNRNISSLMAAGHRRWLLHPALGYTSYGQTQGYSAMKVFGFGQPPATTISPDVQFIAFPYEHYPHVLVSKGSSPTPWSLSMVPPAGASSSYNHFQNSTVTVRETASGNQLSVHSLYHDTRGYGLRNFFSWMVDGWNHDTDYTVTISNVQMPDNSVRQIEYNVHIDLAELR